MRSMLHPATVLAALLAAVPSGVFVTMTLGAIVGNVTGPCELADPSRDSISSLRRAQDAYEVYIDVDHGEEEWNWKQYANAWRRDQTANHRGCYYTYRQASYPCTREHGYDDSPCGDHEDCRDADVYDDLCDECKGDYPHLEKDLCDECKERYPFEDLCDECKERYPDFGKYDWEAFGHPTCHRTRMRRTGCIITSMAMLLYAHGIHEIDVDGERMDLDPGSLSKFIREEGIYSRSSSHGTFSVFNLIDNIPGEVSTIQKKSRSIATLMRYVTATDIYSTPTFNRPAYARVPGHSVVVTGRLADKETGEDIFRMHDPGRLKTSLEERAGRDESHANGDHPALCKGNFPFVLTSGNEASQKQKYSTPAAKSSPTADSYNRVGFYLLGYQPNTHLVVRDDSGNATGWDPVQDEGALGIPRSRWHMMGEVGIETLQEVYIRSTVGWHSAEIWGGPDAPAGTYTLTIETYDYEGDLQKELEFRGISGPESSDRVEVHVSKEPGEEPVAAPVVTFESMLDQIANAFELELIERRGVAQALTSTVQAARRAYERGQPAVASNQLGAFLRQIEAQRDHHIAEEAAVILQEHAEAKLQDLESQEALTGR